MGKHLDWVYLREQIIEILEADHPMTVRQIFYQLVARQLLPNTQPRYQGVGTELERARMDGDIPWYWIEDRTRLPKIPSMHNGLGDFAEDLEYEYVRNIWDTQPLYLEVWLEKDALSGIFWDVLSAAFLIGA